jgi:hypothetical protein
MLKYYFSEYIFWFRVWDYGLVFTSTPMLFSERYGYRKALRITSKWRMLFLRPEKKRVQKETKYECMLR